MSIHAMPVWYKLPPAGEARSAEEGFMQLKSGDWLMGFGRQNGSFACVNVADGTVRWELPVQATCSDVATCDVDGDGQPEFLFGTSHGCLYAVGDAGTQPRVVWKLEVGDAVGAPIPADVDGDGVSDLLVPTADGYVNLYTASGTAPAEKKPGV
jgi:outer membrane protein assembly factor BamB